MGFTTPCFIRKSTYKLRKKLDELGYRLFGAELNEDLCIFTSPEFGLYNIEFFNNIPHPDETDSVDCDEGLDDDGFIDRLNQYVYDNHYDDKIDDIAKDWQLPRYELVKKVLNELKKK